MHRLIYLIFLFSISSAAIAAVKDNYLPVAIHNQTHIAGDDKIFIIIKAMNFASGKNCLMKIDKTTGNASCLEITQTTNARDFSYRLSDLPLENYKRTIFLPKVASGRIYFSIGVPMDLAIDKRTGGIGDPDALKQRDVNYYTLYDKIEFTYGDAGSWVNPTAVDFFSLPIYLEQEVQGSFNKAGLSQSRQAIFNQFKQIFATTDTTQNKVWNKLFLSFDKDSILRVASTGKGMIGGGKGFDPYYLNNQPVYNFDYIANLWDYYQTHSVLVDCSEIAAFFKLNNYLFSGRVVDGHFTFTNQTGSYTVTIDKPTTSGPFFGGAGDSFNAMNNTPKAIIVRQLTSAFEVGLLPAADGAILNKDFFNLNRARFYQNSSLLPTTEQGPWYDLYAKVIHSFGKEQPIYAFAYDDALGQDGTLHDGNGKNPAPINVTLEDLSGTSIPDPYTDNTVYTINPVIGYASVVEYNGAILKSNQSISNVHIPMHIKLNGNDAYIYIKYPIVQPNFPEADGIVIRQTSSNSADIIFPGQ